jgi:hypothetical protein
MLAHMADWRQIQARIRKAKGGTDPAGELAQLYERTHDAMVAFELALWHEKAGGYAEAARWYTTAAERFRRAQWRTKAAEALARLGAPVPVAPPEPTANAEHIETASIGQEHPTLFAVPSSEAPAPPQTPAAEPASEQAATLELVVPAEGQLGGKKRRRRGRRGGRKRRRGGREAHPPAVSEARPSDWSTTAEVEPPSVSGAPQRVPTSLELELEAPQLHEPSQSPPAAPAWQVRARAGEPALASRIAQLESQLRRLLACPMVSAASVDQAPAGPGVLLLSDSDQVTHYYVEACQTLRIGVANLLRGGRGSKEGGRLKARMAENLGIGEARVSKYLKDHCAVRWLQLDEGAAELAHFAIAVLGPVVND